MSSLSARRRARLHRAWDAAPPDRRERFRSAWLRRLRTDPSLWTAPASVGVNNRTPDEMVELGDRTQLAAAFDRLPARLRAFVASPERRVDFSSDRDVLAVSPDASDVEIDRLLTRLRYIELVEVEHIAFGAYGREHPQAGRVIDPTLLVHLGWPEAASRLFEARSALGLSALAAINPDDFDAVGAPIPGPVGEDA